ncbi:MAG: MerR family DNA-binding protein [Trebonia sp.]
MSCSHGRQSTPSSAPEVNPQGGLLPRPARISGQRRYPESADRLVAAILLYSDAGFTLAEQQALLDTRASTPGDRRQLMQRKLAELDEQIARAQAARDAIRHGLRCPTRTSRNAPTSTPASPPGWPASHCHNPAGSCTAIGPVPLNAGEVKARV